MATQVVVSVKLTKPLYELMEKYLQLDAHVSKSDFVRDAIREKLRKDAPWLFEEMLQLQTSKKGASKKL
jgi:Arc/MetJ-type ribon-helix-helix transcriptional regulator